jgi:hypothetical protein
MENKGFRQGFGIAAAAVLLVVLGAVSGSASEVHRFSNGITATVYSPVELTDQWITVEKDGPYLTHPAAGSVELIDNSAVMVPFDQATVVAALEAMHGFTTEIDVSVFILPATPAAAGGSFARRNAIYLSPGTGVADPSTISYITAHEMGHVLTWAFIDDYPARWDAYLKLRQLDASSLSVDARHADRAREILAEDIRALFGGPLATAAGSIENHELVHPYRVEGLKSLLNNFFLGGEEQPRQMTSCAFPNPCNPRTSIEMDLPGGVDVPNGSGRLRIFDIRGALVQTLTGGDVANGRLVIQWDGTGRSGGVVSSGRYLYVLEVGQFASKGSVTLVR